MLTRALSCARDLATLSAVSLIYAIPRARCHAFRALFDVHSDLRVIIDGVFDDCVGEVFADRPDQPQAMMLKVGVYRIMAGDAAAAGSLFDHVEVGEEIVIPATAAWMTAMLGLKTRGLETIERSMDAYGVQQLDPDLLQDLAVQLPPGFDCHEVDAANLSKLGASLRPNRIANFDSDAQFLRIGLGACAMHGEAVVCAATSYAVSKAWQRARGMAWIWLTAERVAGSLADLSQTA